jgi:hypothetical protein
MELTIVRVIDETPKGLTTGFRIKLICQVAGGPEFQLDLPILVGKEVLAQQVPLPRLALAYLRKEGLDAWPDFFVDSRRLDLSAIEKTEPAFPITIPLGGVELLAQRAVEKLTGKKG